VQPGRRAHEGPPAVGDPGQHGGQPALDLGGVAGAVHLGDGVQLVDQPAAAAGGQ
jgi:hypothetical protein